MPVRALAFATALAAVLASALMAGCTSSHAAPSAAATTPPACSSPEPAVLPHTAGSLTEADTGTYCLPAGQVLDVFLTAPASSAPGTRWNHITVADTSVLAYGNNGVLTPPVNVTAEVFVAKHQGTTTLSSTLPDGTAWRATIVVP